MILIEEKELKGACHCSHLMVFVCSFVASSLIWLQTLKATLSLKCFLSKRDFHQTLRCTGNTLQLMLISGEKCPSMFFWGSLKKTTTKQQKPISFSLFSLLDSGQYDDLCKMLKKHEKFCTFFSPFDEKV